MPRPRADKPAAKEPRRDPEGNPLPEPTQSVEAVHLKSVYRKRSGCEQLTLRGGMYDTVEIWVPKTDGLRSLEIQDWTGPGLRRRIRYVRSPGKSRTLDFSQTLIGDGEEQDE